ncbi:TetR/AcrR family transcriptional regulator [Rhodococcus sp. HNM0563]|uniref:TetR/AcrR family transcriptional regulator C-terminal domain-containing protein n=1 Tax=unclassified Rhodococcus (in: high G+C Gram-positive bacteria) TaxID=192944 RepID=UPI00146C076C|nr:TetR/AcrR family transcriptional regulator [Rhodococcus sp. F64268]MCK0090577.1 TetR/AcrR family transcriptional regulator [Rhodococcus sp. F64268]NLU61771.1 TetR/AcrR family transcriptional regulator [Rhodococcus sp. HNM0563]
MAKKVQIVWDRADGTRGPAPSHSRSDLAAVAMELASEGGLPSVSTRRIAQKLGVSQSAVYRYVSGSDDIFDIMVDATVGEIDLDVPLRGEPIDDLIALARRAKIVHVKYPWLLDLPVESMRIGPRTIDFLEYSLRAMASVDVPGHVKMQAIAVLNSLVQQFARAEVSGGESRRMRLTAQVAYLHKIAEQGDHPFVAAALAHPGADDAPGDMFDQVLRRVLEGVLAGA